MGYQADLRIAAERVARTARAMFATCDVNTSTNDEPRHSRVGQLVGFVAGEPSVDFRTKNGLAFWEHVEALRALAALVDAPFEEPRCPFDIESYRASIGREPPGAEGLGVYADAWDRYARGEDTDGAIARYLKGDPDGETGSTK
jgi:hypothetical protein